jgi:hypothetical protein
MTGTQFIRTLAVARTVMIARTVPFPQATPIDPAEQGQGDGWQLVCENMVPVGQPGEILYVWLWQRPAPEPPRVHLPEGRA